MDRVPPATYGRHETMDGWGHPYVKIVLVIKFAPRSITLVPLARDAPPVSPGGPRARGSLVENDPPGEEHDAVAWVRVAHYLLADCVKLRYLLRIFQQEGLWREPTGEQPRFLVFTHWPMVEVTGKVELYVRDAVGNPMLQQEAPTRTGISLQITAGDLFGSALPQVSTDITGRGHTDHGE
ncbi:hypothetical protein IFM53868_06105 [Aspergillus udagawae]|uniref:Uncharacterized protein n=1 Tax=Aspergillus udagawae TaxID=91492 RepID=A0ABQ1AY77_9EURO|nr:hypothetical protein IFM53868_06105 [Aspergillus udagawae]